MYDQISALGPKAAGKGPTLEAYLRSLWQIVSAERDLSLSQERFVGWLAAAFEQGAPAFNQDWLAIAKGDIYLPESYDDASFEDWESFILFQIADLRRMDGAGMLDNEYKYFGIDSPSGERWYNFDPAGFLSCATRGTFGVEANPEPEPLTWGDFIQFLICGQIYE